MAGVKLAAAPIGADAFLIAISTSALLLRFLSRKLSGAGFWWDDWLALAAWPFSVAISSTFFAAAWHGFGQHGGDPTFFLHVLYYDAFLYNTGIALTKLSVLAFYRRIFSITRPLKKAVLFVGAFTIAWWVSFTMASILQCVPIRAYWDPRVKARCENKYAFFLGQAIPNIALDFVLLIMPLHPLWKLNMKRSQKITLVVVFMLGYLNPVVSIIRIVSFIQLGNKTGEDINYNFTKPALWSATEVAIAIFSCSIPSLTYLFRQIAGSTISGSAKELKIQKDHRESGPTYQRGNDARQGRSFLRLPDEVSHIDNAGLDPKYSGSLATVGRNPETTLESYGLDHILVRNDYDGKLDILSEEGRTYIQYSL